MSKLTSLFVCNKKTGEKFISGNDEIIWNTGGTATIWRVQQPYNYQRIISGSSNDDLVIIPVTIVANLPIFTIGDKVVIEKGKPFRPVTKYFGADFKVIEYNATVIVQGFRFDSIDDEWSYIVMEINPDLHPVPWEVFEKNVS